MRDEDQLARNGQRGKQAGSDSRVINVFATRRERARGERALALFCRYDRVCRNFRPGGHALRRRVASDSSNSRSRIIS